MTPWTESAVRFLRRDGPRKGPRDEPRRLAAATPPPAPAAAPPPPAAPADAGSGEGGRACARVVTLGAAAPAPRSGEEGGAPAPASHPGGRDGPAAEGRVLSLGAARAQRREREQAQGRDGPRMAAAAAAVVGAGGAADAGALPRPCADGEGLAPGLALHHDGDPEGVRLVSADGGGWLLEIAEPGAEYLSLAFSPDARQVAPGRGRFWRASAALSVQPLPGAPDGWTAPEGWMRLNARPRAGLAIRSALRDAGFDRPLLVRGFAADALGVSETGAAPESLWLDVILSRPRNLRLALRGVWLESRLRPQP